jgi:signal transduction histidine kinase
MSYLKKIFNPEFADNFDQDLAHKLFLFSAISISIATLSMAVVYFIYNLTEIGYVQFATSIVSGLAILLYYKTKSLSIPMHLIILVFLVTSIYRISKMGGIEAPTFYTIFLVPLYSGFVLGFKSGVFWTVIYLIMAVCFHYATIHGYKIESSYTPSSLAAARIYVIIFSNLFCLSLVFAIRFFINRGKILLQKEKEEKSHLLKIISHDLSAPLTSLSLSLQLIKDRNEPLYIDKAFKALDSINTMIKDIKNFEAIKSGKQILVKRAVTWGQIFDELLFINNSALQSKKITLSLPKEHLEDFIYIDQNILVYQILNNLLSNAIKFSFSGGKIDFFLTMKENKYLFTITDFGIGIPKNLLKEIFSTSSKTNRIGTSGEKGTGFGLPLVKSYIEILSGKIFIQSSSIDENPKQCGTIITIELPVN